MMRAILTSLAVLVLGAALGGCHGNTYNYHYSGHGHYAGGQYEKHYTAHYGNFGHGYGQHGYSPGH